MYGAYVGWRARGNAVAAEAISAPYEAFRKGVLQVRGYAYVEEGDRLHLSFEPWFVDSLPCREIPCLRLTFRRDGDRVVLERFAGCDGREDRPVSLAAGPDALQAWMDCMAD